MKEEKRSKRFQRVYSQGGVNITEIWIDRETGVNYLYHTAGYSGGLTPLLDSHGNVVVTRVENE